MAQSTSPDLRYKGFPEVLNEIAMVRLANHLGYQVWGEDDMTFIGWSVINDVADDEGARWDVVSLYVNDLTGEIGRVTEKAKFGSIADAASWLVAHALAEGGH